MKVLFSVHHELDRNAGAAGVTVRSAEALRERGHTVDVISFDDVPGSEELKRYRFPYFVARHLWRNPGYDVADLSFGDGWIASLLSGSRIIKNSPAILARSHGLEHLFHEYILRENALGRQALSWKYPIYHGGYRLWECRGAISRADAVLFLNEDERQYALSKFQLKPQRAFLIRNAIADHFLRRAKKILQEEDRQILPRNIAFIGNYIPRKGVMILRDALSQVLSAVPDATLTYFGTKINNEKIYQSFPSELRGQIKIVSSYENENLPGALSDQHILAFPSLFEGSPLTPLEAMASGLVPVTTRAESTAYIRDGENGITVPIGDTASLTEALMDLLRNGPGWAKLRKAALSTTLNYSWSTIAEEVEQIYESCLSRKR